MKKLHFILGATNFELHLLIFSKVSTRAGFGGTVYLEITREVSQVFYGFVFLLRGIFYSLVTLFR